MTIKHFLLFSGVLISTVTSCRSDVDRDEKEDEIILQYEDRDPDAVDTLNEQYNTRPESEAGDIQNTFDQCSATLTAIVRDFPDSHPDFHHSGEQEKSGDALVTGMVETDLGPDEKPVLGASRFFSGNLDEWYESIPGVNQTFVSSIQLHESSEGTWTHDNDTFFPLGPTQGYGHEYNADGDGVPRNFLFTTEIRMKFTYKKGQVFRFKGDDDLWVFINGKLAIDLGGIHSQREMEVDIDAHAAATGMTPNGKYTMHIFHAERNPVESHFRIDTNIDCFVPVV